MIHGKKVLAVIPARGGSKGVPRKNIRPLNGKPLIAWTIEEAKLSRYIDRLIISSEDHEIIEIARQYGCEAPFTRPRDLSGDDTPGIAPVIHAIQELPGYDYLILLQPTSPLRRAEDIDRCIELCVNENGSTCVSVVETKKSPYLMFHLNGNKLSPLQIDGVSTCSDIVPRQKLGKTFELDGTLFMGRCDELVRTRSFIRPDTLACLIPSERSYDIDTELDFKIVSMLMEKGAAK
jgi:N-acylneuraminate cytidylyltransferase